MFTNLDVPSVYRDTAQQAVPPTLPRAETELRQRCVSRPITRTSCASVNKKLVRSFARRTGAIASKRMLKHFKIVCPRNNEFS